jgi:hypothetical protein
MYWPGDYIVPSPEVSEEEFENTKVIIIIRKSKSDKQNKKDERTNNDLQYIHVKL